MLLLKLAGTDSKDEEFLGEDEPWTKVDTRKTRHGAQSVLEILTSRLINT